MASVWHLSSQPKVQIIGKTFLHNLFPVAQKMSALSGTLCFAVSCLGIFLCSTAVHGQATNVRVEFELKKFSNAKGIQQTGSKCSLMGGSCNHKLTGYVDTSLPLKGWPGIKRVDDWPTIAEKKDNSPVLNKIISADVCAGSFKQADLRVHVTDSGLTSNKLVEDFDCLSTTDIAPSEMKATWSEERECQAKYNAANNRLTYKVRVYSLPVTSCGKPPSRPK